ncbi:LACH-like protein, partial [Mya arenaria]
MILLLFVRFLALDIPIVAWMDPKLKLLTVSDQRIIVDQRISIERPFTRDWNLHIRQVRRNDSGEYLCQINTQPVKSTKILLIVNEPPIILDHAGDQTVREGETVELWCRVGGEPLPSVTWYRKNKNDHGKATEVIGAAGDGLKIHNISRYCEDDYECVADNGIEPIATQMMTVTVQYASQMFSMIPVAPEVRLLSQKLSQAKGKETILDCTITANPHAYSVWKFRGQELANNAKHGISIYNDDLYTKTLSLRVGNLNDEDFGKYKCYAENIYGSDEESFLLY